METIKEKIAKKAAFRRFIRSRIKTGTKTVKYNPYGAPVKAA